MKIKINFGRVLYGMVKIGYRQDCIYGVVVNTVLPCVHYDLINGS